MPSKKKTTKKSAVKKTTKKAAKKTTRATASKKKTTKKASTKRAASKKQSCGCNTKCKSEHAFWVNNGPVVHSLKELLTAMESMSDKQYEHHANEGENDFARWIKDCLADVDCAQRVRRSKTRVGTVRILKKRCSCK